MPPPEWPFWRSNAETMQRADSAAGHHDETLVSTFRNLVARLRRKHSGNAVLTDWRRRNHALRREC